MENIDTSGTAQEEGLNEEEMNDLIATMEDLFNAIDWITVAEDEEEDTQQ